MSLSIGLLAPPWVPVPPPAYGGTPVLSHPVGAAPEIVTHGVTGFLCPDLAALVAAVDRLPELDRAACRRDVAQRFCTVRMVAEHLTLYEDLMRR